MQMYNEFIKSGFLLKRNFTGILYMKIFKHRGDIYLSKTDLKSDIEQRIVAVAVTALVVFTVVFLTIVAVKNDFSAAKFFKPSNLNVETQDSAEELPEIQGKTNLLFIMNNNNFDEMYFCALIQIDNDTVSYKVSTLDPATTADGKSFAEIYKRGGAANLLNAVNQLFGINVDYYIDEGSDNYKKMFDSMGKVKYMVLKDVKYKDTSFYGFNIKIKAGEQNLDGGKAIDLYRYYIEHEKNYEAVNDIILSALSQQQNEENFAKKEKLFSQFIEYSTTNITVKDFTDNIDSMKVFSSETTGANIYSVIPQYDGNNLTSSSVSEIKGYFSK